MSHLRIVALVLAAAGTLTPTRALATYSIVAVDRATRQVGGAVTSCVRSSVAGVFRSAPGLGGVVAQALSNDDGRSEAVDLLMMGVAPDQIIARLQAASFDRRASERQYGVVDMMGRAAGHTGTDNSDFADDLQGQAGGFTYSIQGNILTGRAVLTQAEGAFRAEACDLADRLMRALEAGAANGEGDNRCTRRNMGRGPPSTSASIQVDRPGEPRGSFLRLDVPPNQQQSNPLPELRRQFDDWRRRNPCPASPPDAGVPPRDAAPTPPTGDASGGTAPDGASGSGGGGGSPTNPRPADASAPQGGEGRPPDASSGGAGTGGSPANGGSPVAPGTGGAPGTAGSTGGPPGAPGNTGAVAPPTIETPAAPTSGGCRTGSGRPGPVAMFLAAALLLLASRRRR